MPDTRSASMSNENRYNGNCNIRPFNSKESMLFGVDGSLVVSSVDLVSLYTFRIYAFVLRYRS